MMSMSIFVKISVMNAEESPESQAMKSTTMTIDELVRYLIQWTILWHLSSSAVTAKLNQVASQIKQGLNVVAKMVYGTDVADDV